MKTLYNNFLIYIKQIKPRTLLFYSIFIFFVFFASIRSFIYTKQSPVEVESSSTISEVENTAIYVQITGGITSPGVYQLEEGARMFDLIEMAGGFNNANTDCINQATLLSDEQNIYIPLESEPCSGESMISDTKTSDLININTATQDELMQLPSIGETRADDIISYRETNGDFNTIEDLQNVSGIGDTTYTELEPLITV